MDARRFLARAGRPGLAVLCATGTHTPLTPPAARAEPRRKPRGCRRASLTLPRGVPRRRVRVRAVLLPGQRRPGDTPAAAGRACGRRCGAAAEARAGRAERGSAPVGSASGEGPGARAAAGRRNGHRHGAHGGPRLRPVADKGAAAGSVGAGRADPRRGRHPPVREITPEPERDGGGDTGTALASNLM